MTGLALSIRQPWAWAIVHGGKRIENRSWRTSYRGPILIHAAAALPMRECREALAAIAEIEPALVDRWPGIAEVERGGIIGRAELVDCVAASTSPWFCGPWGFVLDHVEPLPFRSWRGSLGLFRVPDGESPR